MRKTYKKLVCKLVCLFFGFSFMSIPFVSSQGNQCVISLPSAVIKGGFLTIGSSTSVQKGQDLSQLVLRLSGAKLVAQDSDNTYLGKITNELDPESVFNDYGKYGNEYSHLSIWNPFSKFGNEFNPYSPFNEFSNRPPKLIKNDKVVGFLTKNKFVSNSVSPTLLKELKDQF